jgi:hypothetical protein
MQRKVGIGKYDTVYDDGWRRAEKADWTNPAFQAALVQAHREGGGWTLLEEPLECNNGLCATEGQVWIDGATITEVGFTYGAPDQLLRGVYPAMNNYTKVGWTTTAPAPGNTWTVDAWQPFGNPPCLFVQVLCLTCVSCVVFFGVVLVFVELPNRKCVFLRPLQQNHLADMLLFSRLFFTYDFFNFLFVCFVV